MLRLRPNRHLDTLSALSGWFFRNERVEEKEEKAALENSAWDSDIIVSCGLSKVFLLDVIITAFVMKDGVLYSF